MEHSEKSRILVLFECVAGYLCFDLIDRDRIERIHNSRNLCCSIDELRLIIELADFVRFSKGDDSEANKKEIPVPPPDTCSSSVYFADSSKSCPRILRRYLKHLSKTTTDFEVLTISNSLANAIESRLEIHASVPDFVSTLVRFVRIHLSSFLPEDVSNDLFTIRATEIKRFTKTRLRALKQSNEVNVVRAIKLFDSMNEEMEKTSDNVREEYGEHFPELSAFVPDRYDYCKFVKAVGHRSNIREARPILRDFLEDSVIDHLANSLGPLRPVDISKIQEKCDLVIGTLSYRDQLKQHIEKETRIIMPNLCDLVGELCAARFLAKAGSSDKLSKWTSSDFQIAGLQKEIGIARNKATSESKKIRSTGTVIATAPILRSIVNDKEKSRLARTLACKIAIVVRIDLLSSTNEERLTDTGKKMLAALEAKTKKIKLNKGIPHEPKRNEEKLTEDDAKRLREMEILFDEKVSGPQPISNNGKPATIVDGRNYYQNKAAERVRRYNILHGAPTSKRQKYEDLDEPKNF